ncbi:MAG: hypothetical protein L6W00_08110 [Lentisphaeria bacterium]|nr:MAG: hypothetical protein L6W00_08110 [Lentisphaeria bacterium]
MTAGGICGGLAVARRGFGRMLWPLVCAINLPDIVYVYLAEFQPQSLWIIGSCIAVEQFGYGLGYTAFMLVMVAAAESSGAYKTSHFAIMTGISILGLCLIGMISGWVQEFLGFAGFFPLRDGLHDPGVSGDDSGEPEHSARLRAEDIRGKDGTAWRFSRTGRTRSPRRGPSIRWPIRSSILSFRSTCTRSGICRWTRSA